MLRLLPPNMVSEALVSPRGRRLRFALFALFPVALLLSVLLLVRTGTRSGRAELRIETDRSQAIAAARRFLLAQGVDAAAWRPFCTAIPDADLFRYLRSKPGPASERARELTPPVVVRVMLQSPNTEQRALVTLSPNNRILGFDLRNALAAPLPGNTSEEESMRQAEQLIASDLTLTELLGRRHPEVATVDQTPNGVTRKYTWRRPMPGLRELEAEFSAAIRGGRTLSRLLTANVDPDYASRSASGEGFLPLFGMTFVLYLLVVTIYSVVSYVRLAAQKEVSHSRTMWMGLLITLLYLSVILNSYDDVILQLANSNRSPPVAFIFTVLVLAITAGGLLLGVGYGSGEGQVREAYPGKLTSLDALVTGKLFSSNVGGAIVIGTAFAAWLLLFRELALSAVSVSVSSQELNTLKFPFMPAAWLSFFTSQPAVGLLFAVAGLLQPLAFVTRVIRNRQLAMAVLILFSMFTVSGTATLYASLPGFLIITAVSVACLLIPFFLYDLLAAIVSLVALESIIALVRIPIMFPAWRTLALSAGTVWFVTFAIAMVCWRRGRVYRDEEVRPEYARRIAERQALQEEVAAAREAQLRLLPESPPSIPGLSIYASCLPARVVGGDFYDFFALSDDRLGVFIAEGGNRGLASALSIALAKGYLMHVARGPYSPTEVIQKLEFTLGSILEGNVVRTTVAYGIIDVRRGTLRYARTGAYPKIVLSGGGTGTGIVEREVRNTAGAHPIREGSADLAEGDSMVFYTDGIARRIAARSAMLQEDWIRRLARDRAGAQDLHLTLLESIGATLEKGPHDLEDDLTAIVVRYTEAGVAVLEVVA